MNKYKYTNEIYFLCTSSENSVYELHLQLQNALLQSRLLENRRRKKMQGHTDSKILLVERIWQNHGELLLIWTCQIR